uniref:Uncharacterized protein n=1 Tax=Peronospora matthiolae TaxID=2874970 RepID=A0AAV1U4S3_9STRA
MLNVILMDMNSEDGCRTVSICLIHVAANLASEYVCQVVAMHRAVTAFAVPLTGMSSAKLKIGGGSSTAVCIVVAAAPPKVTTPPSQFMTRLQYKFDGYQILSARRWMQTR